MAGDQCKNQFAYSIALDGSQDHYKVKRKKSGFSRYALDMKSHISLKWDDSKKNVVAKTEQIGISRRDLIQVADGVLPRHNIVADVITVPPEIFRLDNLADVLTYEVWQNCLTGSERSILTQFLPKSRNSDLVVQQLLSGDNFHFGNPFLNWGASLCLGTLHPDNILTTEKCSRATKKAYYSELQTYHTDMIESVQIWKERAVDCKDLKDDIIQRIWRSRNNSKKRVFTPKPGVPEIEENVYTTPESSCPASSETVCSSDNLNGFMMQGEMSRRKDSTTSKIDNSSDWLTSVSKLRKGEMLLKPSIQHDDGARYMSYVKVSKSQHQRLKGSMKHSSSSIQPKSLNSVLGNIDSLHIQPFEVYEEEEWRKLHDHWLQLANKDLPPFVANWRNMQSQRLQLAKSLGQAMEEKLLKCQKESFDQDKEESSCDVPLEPLDSFDANVALTGMEELEVAPSIPVAKVPGLTFSEPPAMEEKLLKCQKESFDQDKEESSCDVPLEPLDSFDANVALTGMEELEVAPSIPVAKVPGLTFSEPPVMIEEEAPATAMTLDESPSMTEEATDAVTEEESPAMTEEESPAMTEEESPPMNNEEPCQLTKEDELQSNGLMEEQQDNELGKVGLLTFEDKGRVNIIRDSGNFVSVSTRNDHMHQTISLNDGHHHYDDMDIETRGNLDLKKEDASMSSSKYPLNLVNIDVPVNQEDSIASAVDTWPQVNMPSLFYHSTPLSHGYPSNELSLGHPQVEEQPSQLLRLDAFNGERIGGSASLDAFNGERIGGRDALQRHPGPLPFFSPFPSQDRNELYQSFYKSETDLSYQHDQKQTEIEFQRAGNLSVETGQYSGPMREQLHSSLPLELRQKGLSDFYVNQNIQESTYSDGGSYPIQRQETLPLNVRDWTANPVHMSAPPQSHMNGGLLNQNWYAGDNPARGSWSGMDGGVGPSQSIGSGGTFDQSLFRVLSECNELQSGAQYDPMSSSRRFMQSGNYGGVTGGIHTGSHILPQAVNSLNYSSELDSTAGYKSVSSLGMMNMQHQTPCLEETIDNKTFLRSWNQ